MNKNMCYGIFRGGDIEPGTFHARNIANVSGNRSEMPISEDFPRDNLEVASAPDALIPTTETGVVF